AVLHDPGREDLFAVGKAGNIYWITGAPVGGPWQAPAPLPAGASTAANADVTAVVRDSGQEDVVTVTASGALAVLSQKGSSWQIRLVSGSNLTIPSAKVAALMRNSAEEDVFVAGNNEAVYTTSQFNDGPWDQPRQITSAGLVPVGASVTATVRHGTL